MNGSTFTTIEGKTSEQVKRCTSKVNDGYTYGFGRPKYDSGNNSTPTTPAQPSTTLKYKVGDVVQFKGGAHYASSNAATDAGTTKAGAAKVTAIAKEAKHPYHIIHTYKQSTVYGWVDADLVGKA